MTWQIAASNPFVLNREQIEQETINQELEIYRQQVRNIDKPEEMIEKIALGKLNSYFKEVCLMDQPFIKDSLISIKYKSFFK